MHPRHHPVSLTIGAALESRVQGVPATPLTEGRVAGLTGPS